MSRVLGALLILMALPALAAEESLPYHFKSDTGNLASVQRGARDFMNYCSGCHGLKYLRYNRMGKDLGIPDGPLKADLMFTSDKLGEHILSSMPAASKDPTQPSESEKWFGKAPPDLSLTGRARGPDWVYSYLMTFYLDPSRPTGVNNLVLPNAAMPHVLGDLQGYQRKVEEAGGGEEGEPKFELAQKGSMSPEEYKAFVADLTNFLTYAAEPGRRHRMAVGVGVLAFVLIFWALAYLLKVEYWKDVH